MNIFRRLKKISTGKRAEQAAIAYLKKQGVRIVVENYHSRFGEIDIIASEGSALVFVEVRCRAVDAQVSAVESISPHKIAKIRKTAEMFLMQYDELPECRFDVIALTHQQKTRGTIEYSIQWIRDAFE